VTVAYLQSTGDRHAQLVGGLTVLERRVRELAKAGVTRALIATEPMELSRPMPIAIQFVPPGSPVPEGARVERADIIAGIEIVDEEARRDAPLRRRSRCRR